MFITPKFSITDLCCLWILLHDQQYIVRCMHWKLHLSIKIRLKYLTIVCYFLCHIVCHLIAFLTIFFAFFHEVFFIFFSLFCSCHKNIIKISHVLFLLYLFLFWFWLLMFDRYLFILFYLPLFFCFDCRFFI